MKDTMGFYEVKYTAYCPYCSIKSNYKESDGLPIRHELVVTCKSEKCKKKFQIIV